METLLYLAVCDGNKEILELLLKKEGIDANKLDTKGQTPLHFAINNNKGMIKLLLEVKE